MNFNLKKPCANCPFLKEGAIELRPGRVEGIQADLLANDFSTFQCHKTVHSKKGGEWDDEGNYQASGNESACMGALGWLWKRGRLPVLGRLAMMRGDVTKDQLNRLADRLID